MDFDWKVLLSSLLSGFLGLYFVGEISEETAFAKATLVSYLQIPIIRAHE